MNDYEISLRFSFHVLLIYLFAVTFSQGDGACNFDNWCPENHGNCQWTQRHGEAKKFYLEYDSNGSRGYALLTKEFKSSQDPSDCISFLNGIYYHNDDKPFFIIFNNGHRERVDTSSRNKELEYCHPYNIPQVIKITFNASCKYLLGTNYIANVSVGRKRKTPPPTEGTTEGSPTEIGDIQYVGVVVGAICIALFTLFSCLTIISARRSNQRDSRRRDVETHSCNEEDDRPDVVADNAPPSYDAVMACPDMYPPTPQGTPPGTPDTTPYLSLHRRALLNQLGGSLPGSPQSQRQSMTAAVSEQWDEERDPPPPYPGLSNENVENRTSESNDGDRNNVESGSGENTPEIINLENTPRTSDLGQRNSGPWILNNACMELNPRGNNPDSRDSRVDERQLESGARNSTEISLRPRVTEPENDNSSQNEQTSEGASSDNGVIENHIELSDSRDTLPKSDKNGLSTIPHLTLV